MKKLTVVIVASNKNADSTLWSLGFRNALKKRLINDEVRVCEPQFFCMDS